MTQEEKPKKSGFNPIDNYEVELGGWTKFFLFMIAVGVVLTIVQYVSELRASNYAASMAAFVILHMLSFVALGGYTTFAFITRKANAVFWAYSYLALCLVSNIFAIVCNLEWSTVLYECIRAVISGALWMFFLYFSENIRDVFPKENRKVTRRDWGVSITAIVLPLVYLVFAIAGLAFSEVRTQAITEDMMEVYTEQEGYYNDGIVAFRAPVGYTVERVEENNLVLHTIVDDPEEPSESIVISSEFFNQIDAETFGIYLSNWSDGSLLGSSRTVKVNEEKTVDGIHMHYVCTHFEDYDLYWDFAVVNDPSINKNTVISVYTHNPGDLVHFMARNIKFK